ncbi:NAD(P)/FAD-dependent oxidoreductase [Pseudorhodobacter ferrugineus]|uniref:NAD(P)/FAD-dependent oxidoreductase n=1 Tax=Pseudorhodobacter ferrugineus TaxID=77008 RepID=UPI0003B4B6CB|nr:FAD-binding oxidoreductase [Pseudorhodobacter ferrugineus]
MTQVAKTERPARASYDVVIVGGAMMGSSTAWFLAQNPDFNGTVLVVERDPSYEFAATSHTNSCIRQQFSTGLNVKISQFGAEFVQNLPRFMGSDAPKLTIQNFGYMYLANSAAFADVLRASHKVQVAAGAATQLMTPDQIKAAYPFYAVDDLTLGSINTVDEGYFDGITLFDMFRRGARAKGAEYIANEVVAITKNPTGSRVDRITLATGETIACGQLVNASGTRGAKTAAMAGIDIPIEPRKRFTWIFTAEQPLDRPLPLTIDPSGVHFRQDGKTTYMAGGHADYDPAVDQTDFEMDHTIWQDHIWPAIATRVPQFEAIKVIREWVGHYDMNTLDKNAIVGPHHDINNFLFLNGFSGHGLQQSPAMGRGTAEWLVYGGYRSLDLSPLGFDRVLRNQPYLEKAII